MKITTWGCRGSICSPGPGTIRYGGNTTCLEIRTTTGKMVVVDAGSGLRNLGKALLKDPETRQIGIVLTHAHWDHLMGFPFFTPAYLPNFKITLCGGPSAQDTIKKYLDHQMEAPYFPVDFSVMKAQFIYGCTCPEVECAGSLEGIIGEHQCHSIPLSHPNGGYGYKFNEQGRVFVFLTDNEIGFHHSGGMERKDYVDFCRDADLLFHDAQYTDQEYKMTKGWGHSTYAEAVALAIDAGVKRLGLFHHDPDRTDDDLDHQVEVCREQISRAGSAMECFAVAEGTTLEV